MTLRIYQSTGTDNYEARAVSVQLQWELKMSLLQRKAALLGMVALSLLCAQQGTAQDSVFAALQQRGKMAMGVDQIKSQHQFDILPTGGRIALEMKGDDSLSIAQIRAHLKLIEHAFQAGDFSTPEFVHMRSMPGTEVMTRNKARIVYSYADLPRGGEVRITTTDPESLAAIRAFMTAQRGDHMAHGMGESMK